MKQSRSPKAKKRSNPKRARHGEATGGGPQDPTDLPRFQVLEKLGEGGVAAVSKAVDRKSGTVRAVKALRRKLIADKQALDRFQDEFRILRHLHHPGLPEMYDYGIAEDGTPFMVMEFIDGEPLDTYCSENPDDLRLLLYQITEALSFIHSHNLLHLDIKPDNILVRRSKAYGRSEKPEAVLIDFGMSYRRDAAGEVTVSGTPAYMPPEIIRREEHLTRAADYYSLGATIYEIIEGKVPFKGSLEEVLRAHLRDDISFQRETVEYTDLYPRVRELMSKEVTPRLEGFEAFRRELAARESEAVPPLERAYAMGYIESMGMIGKHDIWEDLQNWVETTTRELDERTDERTRVEQKPFIETEREAEDSSIITSFDLIKDLEEKRRAGEGVVRPGDKPKGPIKNVPRTIVITGAEGGGKSYLTDAFRGECLLRGMEAWVLGEGGDYSRLVSENMFAEVDASLPAESSVDPKALIIDRHVRGWERLHEAGRKNGAVLIIDGYQKAADEEREFLEYIGKRLQLVLNEDKEPGIFLVVSDRSPSLPRRLATILPKGEKRKHLIVPPPSVKDIEEILDTFHGQMAGTDDRKLLGEYLKQNQSGSGALIAALKRALLQRSLVRERGRWRFSWTSRMRKQDVKKDGLSYYSALYQELGDNERELIAWLSCRRDSIYRSELAEISGMSSGSLNASLERLKPYRLIEISGEAGLETLAIISRTVADGLYESIPETDAKRINEKYIAYYEKQYVREDLPSSSRICEALALHYGRTGDIRNSILFRIRALRALKALKDLFAIRRLCEAGIRETRSLRGKRWNARKWHIERFFLKEWIEAEWEVDNFHSIVSLVRENFIKRRRSLTELPLSSYYRYGMSLRSTGSYEQCSSLIDIHKRSCYSIAPPHIAISLLLEAALLNNLSRYKESLITLKKLNRYRKYLQRNIICKIDLYFILNFHRLGEHIEYSKYLKYFKKLANKSQFYDELLFIYFHEIKDLVNQSKYSAAKVIFRKAISLAIRNKMYHRLCGLYHLQSGISYEEGDYLKAIKILNKSQELSSNLGLIQTTIQCKQRISYNLENMGMWGAAILSSEETKSASLRSHQDEYYYESNIDLLNLYTKIGSSKAHYIKKECERITHNNRDKSSIALYEYTLGYYHEVFRDIEIAILEYKKARLLYLDIKYKDDSIRSAIKIVYAYLKIGKYSEALKMIRKTSLEIKDIESKDIIADYWTSVLKYKFISRSNKKDIYTSLKLCEKLILKTSDINIILRMSKIMFRVYSRFGEAKKALFYFKLYQDKMKTITNHLGNEEFVSSFMMKSNYAQLTKEAKIVMNRKLSN